MRYERFVGRVVDVQDPEQAGRLKIRIYGLHDDEARIPDSSLPWARCVYPVTNPVHAGVAGPTTGMVVGSTVVGHFLDAYRQVPLVDGVLGSTSETNTDFPRAGIGEDINAVLENSIFHIGSAELRSLTNRTIGSIEYTGQSVNTLMQQIGEGNISGALSTLRDATRTFNSLRRLLTDSPQEQLNSIIAGFTSDLQQILGPGTTSLITSATGIVINSPTSLPGTTSGIQADFIRQVTALTGANFNTVNHLISAIGTVSSLRSITTAGDALNRVNGSRFVMGSVMPGLDGTLTKIRSAMNEVNTIRRQASSLLNEVQGLRREIGSAVSSVNTIRGFTGI